MELKPCPFCGGGPEIYACDDDSFTKTVVARCQNCFCRVETSVNWRPFSETSDYDGFDAAVQKAGGKKWNRRI